MTTKATPLVFSPVTRWVLAWKDGSTLRCYDDYGRDTGPELFINRAWAQSAARGRIGIAHGSKPVKVRVTIEVAPMTNRRERGCWLWERCYKCGHRLRFASTACPQCNEEFDGRKAPTRWPEQCDCQRCELARDEAAAL